MLRRSRARLWRLWDTYGWTLIWFGVGLALVLGFVGWTQYSARAGADWSPATRLYLTLQLFALDGGGVDGAVPLTLEVARFLAPLTLATAAIGATLTVLQRTNATWRARSMSDHLVVVGLGERGWLIAQRAKEAGTPVVAIEQDATNPHVLAARRAGVPVINGNATVRGTLAAAGVHRAQRLISVVGTPLANAAVAQTVLEYQREAEFTYPDRFSSFVELADVAAMHALQTFVEHDRVRRRQEFFNLEDRAGLAIADRHDLFAGLSASDQPPPVVVVGSGTTALAVLAAAARRWESVFRADGGHAAPRVAHLWLLAGDAEATTTAAARARRLHPELTKPDAGAVVVLHVHALDPLAPDAGLGAVPGDPWAAPPALVVVATDDETEQIRMAIAARSRLLGAPTPIVVTAPRRQSLVSLLTTDRGAGGTLTVFAIDDELCSDDQIRRGRLDAMARALHDGYLRHLTRTLTPEELAVAPAGVPWEELPERLRRQNDAAAQALWDMLTEEGYLVVPRTAGLPPAETFPDDVVERLAEREHLRWFRGKHPGHPDPSWASVRPDHREQTRDQVRRIPDVLAAAGLQAVPRDRLSGATGTAVGAAATDPLTAVPLRPAHAPAHPPTEDRP